MPKKVEVQVSVAIISDSSKLAAAIVSIESRGKKLDKDIHQAAVSVLVHAEQHGDITLSNKLIDALPKSARRNALLAWLTSFGPYQLTEDAKHVAYRKLSEPVNVAAAIAEPFWEFAPEAKFVPFDLKAALEQVVSKATKAVADSEHAGENYVPLDKLEGIRAILAQFADVSAE